MEKGLPKLNVAIKWSLRCFAQPSGLSGTKADNRRKLDNAYDAFSDERWSSKKHRKGETPWAERVGSLFDFVIVKEILELPDESPLTPTLYGGPRGSSTAGSTNTGKSNLG